MIRRLIPTNDQYASEPAYADILAGLQQRYRDLKDFYEVNPAVLPASRGDEGWWKKRETQLNQNAQATDIQLAFIGDSITQGWEGAGQEVWREFYGQRRAINLGISGDRTEHVIWRLTNGNLGKIQPKVAVLMIGTNNTGHVMQPPRQVAEGVQEILSIMQQRCTHTQVVLLGIFPRGPHAFDARD